MELGMVGARRELVMKLGVCVGIRDGIRGVKVMELGLDNGIRCGFRDGLRIFCD